MSRKGRGESREANLCQSCPIPDPLPYKDLPPNLTVLRRCTLILTESHQNSRLTELSRHYDILAVRPIDERTLQLACSSLDCDVISPDMTQRLPFWFKFKMLSEAMGCVGLRCEAAGDVDATIDKAMAIDDAPVVIDFTVGKDAMVWPMVAAGASNDEIQAARDVRPDFSDNT